MTDRTIDGSEFSDEARKLITSVLALTVAAGGRIEVREADMCDLSEYKLVVTEDKVAGTKTYEAIRER